MCLFFPSFFVTRRTAQIIKSTAQIKLGRKPAPGASLAERLASTLEASLKIDSPALTPLEAGSRRRSCTKRPRGMASPPSRRGVERQLAGGRAIADEGPVRRRSCTKRRAEWRGEPHADPVLVGQARGPGGSRGPTTGPAPIGWAKLRVSRARPGRGSVVVNCQHQVRGRCPSPVEAR
jgi:hypothetical protein